MTDTEHGWGYAPQVGDRVDRRGSNRTWKVVEVFSADEMARLEPDPDLGDGDWDWVGFESLRLVPADTQVVLMGNVRTCVGGCGLPPAERDVFCAGCREGHERDRVLAYEETGLKGGGA